MKSVAAHLEPCCRIPACVLSTMKGTFSALLRATHRRLCVGHMQGLRLMLLQDNILRSCEASTVL